MNDKYFQPAALFFLVHFEKSDVTEREFEGYNYCITGFDLHLERSITQFATNIYMPTGLMVVASWIGFVIPPETVPGRMALLVTLLLMLINLSGNASYQSPSKSKLTALDSWLLACVLFVTAALFEYAHILRIKLYSHSKSDQTKKEMNCHKETEVNRHSQNR
jgi:hypothetical protein